MTLIFCVLFTLLYSMNTNFFEVIYQYFFDPEVNEPDPFGDLTESEEYIEVRIYNLHSETKS